MTKKQTQAPLGRARVVREFGPFPGVSHVHGVTCDGEHVIACVGHALLVIDKRDGTVQRTLSVEGSAGTAFDGRHVYQIRGAHILVIDPRTGAELRRIDAPGRGRDTGLAFAEGRLWVGQHRDRRIDEVDPQSGEVLRTIRSDRFVTGVTWASGALWHGTLEDDESELRRVDVDTGAVLERLALPAGVHVTGVESDGEGGFYCGGGASGKIREVRRDAPQGAATGARRPGA